MEARLLLRELVDKTDKLDQQTFVRVYRRGEGNQVTHMRDIPIARVSFPDGHICVEQADLDKCPWIPLYIKRNQI